MRIDPNRVVYELIPKTCDVCGDIQWCFFTKPEDFVSWECPCKVVEKEIITDPIS